MLCSTQIIIMVDVRPKLVDALELVANLPSPFDSLFENLITRAATMGCYSIVLRVYV